MIGIRATKCFEKLYSSKLRISRRVIRMERYVATSLSHFLNNSKMYDYRVLASNLEWMFTWKLKTKCMPEFFWCDGVDEIVLTKIGKYEIKISAILWLGPESNMDIIKKERFFGKVYMKPSGKGLRYYQFYINFGDSIFVVSKI